MHFFNTTLLASFSIVLLLAVVPAKAENKHTPLDKHQWTFKTDPYGSEAIINKKLIRHGGIWIKFKRVPSTDEKHKTWTDLIHKVPASSLVGIQKIRLTYQTETPLLIKLPQQKYDKNGDKNYAFYQIELPATKQWITEEVALKDFTRPHWTPTNSTDVGLLPEHVKEIYFTPILAGNIGGEAIIQVRAIELLP